MALRQVQQVSEIDELVEAWPGSDIHPVQVTSGPLDLRIDGVVAEELSVFRLTLSPRLIDHVQISSERTGFVLVERPMISMGVEIDAPMLLINHPGREYRSVLHPGFQSLEFMLSNSAIETHPLASLLADVRSVQDQTLIPLTARSAAELRGAADAYLCATEVDEACLQDAARSRLLDRLTRLLQVHCGVSVAEAYAPARGSIALAALREIERIGPEHVRLQEICGNLGVTRRAVEKSFQSVLSVSPAQYLLACRLNRFRLALLGPAERVSDGLAEAGLDDASRAARQYRRLFGELPSTTLQRAQAAR